MMKKVLIGIGITGIITLVIVKILKRDKYIGIVTDCPIFVDKNDSDVTYMYQD